MNRKMVITVRLVEDDPGDARALMRTGAFSAKKPQRKW